MKIVKVHKNESPHPGNGVAWLVSQGAAMYGRGNPASGPIAFITKEPQWFYMYFAQAFKNFKLNVQPGQKVYPYLGTYLGKTEAFSALSYRHQRNALHSAESGASGPDLAQDSLKIGRKGLMPGSVRNVLDSVGIHTHRPSAGNFLNAVGKYGGKVMNGMEAIADPASAAAGKLIEKVHTKHYFLAFRTDQSTDRMFNNQQDMNIFPALKQQSYKLEDLWNNEVGSLVTQKFCS